MKRHVIILSVLLALGTSLAVFNLRCGDGGADEGAWGPDYNNREPGAGSDAASSADVLPPPEEELELNLQAPQASEHYVYVAATSRDALVRIDAQSLDIRVIPVGGQPTRVATLPKGDVAIVINSGTNDVSIVRSSPNKDDVTTLDVLPYVNAIAVSPSGAYAVIYYNQALAQPNDPVGDFQTVAVLRTSQGKEEILKVSTGFHITQVYFHATKPLAYLVTDDGVSVVALDKVEEGSITHIVPVSDDPFEDPSVREVLVTEDGSHAVVRHLAKDRLTVVNLLTDERVNVQLPGLPTDVDLVPGRDLALVMLREQGLAVLVDLDAALEGEQPEAVLETIDISGSKAGAAVIAAQGDKAVLYTTVGQAQTVAVLDLAQEPFTWKGYPVQKRIVGVAVSQYGSTAVIYHESQAPPANASALEKTIALTEGFTVFDLDTGYRKLIQTDHRWTDSLFIPGDDGQDRKAYVLTPDPAGLHHVVVDVDVETFLAVETSLISHPESLVYVPLSAKVAVAQEHPNGRITFLDVQSGDAWSVSGYELNGLIH